MSITPFRRKISAFRSVTSSRSAEANFWLGYEVVTFDTSKEMVRLARARLGGRADVHLLRFDDVSWRGEFDGIWACASLLHQGQRTEDLGLI